MPSFKDRYRDLQELVREHTLLRRHNLNFKAGDPQGDILMFAEGLTSVVIMERFVRIILGHPTDHNGGKPLTLFPLLQRAVKEEVLTLPHADQKEGIKMICEFRNGLLHGNFEQVAALYQTDVVGYFKTRFAGDIEAMYKLDDQLMQQIDPDTGARYVARIDSTIDIPAGVIERLCVRLTETFGAPVPVPRIKSAMLSANAPSWIGLIFEHPIASIVLPSAAVFVKKLVELAAADLWANKALIAQTMKEAGATVFAKVAQLLSEAAEPSGSVPRAGIESGHDRAVLSLPAGNEEASLALALLVLRAADLRRLLRDDIGPKSRGPVIHLMLEKDGTLVVSWFDGTAWVERRMPLLLAEQEGS